MRMVPSDMPRAAERAIQTGSRTRVQSSMCASALGLTPDAPNYRIDVALPMRFY
jgi:hypothetical protein